MEQDNWREKLAAIKREQLQARGLFEADPEVQALTGALISATAHMVRGETLTWDRVTEVTGLTRSESRFWTVVNRWRKNARENWKIETWCMAPNLGVTLLDNQGNIEVVAAKRTRKAARQSRQVLRAIGATDRSKLTDKQMLMAHHFEQRAKEALRRQPKEVGGDK